VESITDDCQVVFVHKTFAEFFAAKYLSEIKFKEKYRNIYELLLTPKFSITFSFFNNEKCQRFSVHLAVLNQDCNPIKHPKQLSVVDDFGRTPLHLAAAISNKENYEVMQNNLFCVRT